MRIAFAAAAALLLMTGGALAQTMGNGPTNTQTQHATGGGVGVAGLPGSKSGPAQTPQGTVGSNAQNPTTAGQQNTSKVKGAPGTESGRTSNTGQ